MRSLLSGLFLLLFVFLLNSKSIADSSSGADSTSSLVGTWQILNLDSAQYSKEEIQTIEHVRIQFGTDGTYRRVIQYWPGNSTRAKWGLENYEWYKGSYVTGGDTVHVHWIDPRDGGDFAGVAHIMGDTLHFQRFGARLPEVSLVRVEDSIVEPKLNYAPTCEISSKLIDQLKRYRIGKPSREIVMALYGILYPSATDLFTWEEQQGFLRVIDCNLDTDQESELIVLTGPTSSMTEEYDFLVLKCVSSKWHIIYATDIRFWYEDPEIHVLNDNSPNKTFYTYELTDRGTGLYRDLYRFFKLIDGRVYDCLSTVHREHIFNWGRSLDLEVHSTVDAVGGDADQIQIKYKLKYWASYDVDTILSSEDLPFVDRRAPISFQWVPDSRTFQPVYQDGSKGLTKEQLEGVNYFEFADDNDFVSAFSTDLKEIASHGGKDKVRLLEEYLKVSRVELENPHPEPRRLVF